MLPMLCANYDAKAAATAAGPHGFYASEKYDGWRMFYRDGRFFSRAGRPLSPPEHIVVAAAALASAASAAAPLALDGELWLGYDRFQDTHAALDARSPELQWLLFDMPSASGGYAERLTALGALFAVAGIADARVRVVAQTHCADVAALDAYYDAALTAEPRSEGIVVRPADLAYEWNTRPAVFMKRKPFRDLEATVIAYHTVAPRTAESAAARPEGYVSSLVCEMRARREDMGDAGALARFRVAYKAARPPPIGALVTIKYQNLTDEGLPRFPTLKGRRALLDAPAPPLRDPATPAVRPAPAPLPKGAVATTLRELAAAARLAAESGIALDFAPGRALYIAAASPPGAHYCVRRPRQAAALPYCTCAAWKFQRLAPAARVCKHTAAVLAALGRPTQPTPMIRAPPRAAAAAACDTPAC